MKDSISTNDFLLKIVKEYSSTLQRMANEHKINVAKLKEKWLDDDYKDAVEVTQDWCKIVAILSDNISELEKLIKEKQEILHTINNMRLGE